MKLKPDICIRLGFIQKYIDFQWQAVEVDVDRQSVSLPAGFAANILITTPFFICERIIDFFTTVHIWQPSRYFTIA